jgi:hypothetical protein
MAHPTYLYDYCYLASMMATYFTKVMKDFNYGLFYNYDSGKNGGSGT